MLPRHERDAPWPELAGLHGPRTSTCRVDVPPTSTRARTTNIVSCSCRGDIKPPHARRGAGQVELQRARKPHTLAPQRDVERRGGILGGMVTDIKAETNKVVAQRVIEEVFEKGDEEAIDELFAPDFIPHNWATGGHGPEAVKRAVGRAKEGLTDPKLTVDDIIGEGDKVVLRV